MRFVCVGTFRTVKFKILPQPSHFSLLWDLISNPVDTVRVDIPYSFLCFTLGSSASQILNLIRLLQR